MLTLGWGSGTGTKLAHRKMEEMAALLGRLAGIDITVRAFVTYDELTQTILRGEVDIAWLPPISFLALIAKEAVLPLASVRAVPYMSAFIVAPDSPLQKPASLVGTRAAWVDRHSASGFVVPRIKLSRFGIDPRGAFSSETFYESHDAVVGAVVNGEADFGATWVQPGSRGAVTGPWTRTSHEVRVLATFGSIPPDVIAARTDLTKPARKAIVAALKSIYDERQNRWLVGHVMGTQAFYRPKLELYTPLQESVVEAYQSGILDVGPPPRASNPDPHTGVRRTLQQPDTARAFVPSAVMRAASKVDDPDIVDDQDIELVETQENPRPPQWSLPEIDGDEDIDIDVTFD
jgi:phosphate/phosphite/phosphonate ABC transporter binding protein